MNHSRPIITYGLLAAVIMIWAISWPATKVGLLDMPPIWFSTVRLWIGFFTIFIILLFQNKIKIPSRKDLPLILTIGLLQMASFIILINGGLLFVDAGRSGILVYSTPLIVTPIAIAFFGEKLSRNKLLGLILGGLGIIVLFNPWSFDWHNQQIIIGNLLLLLAAVCWAIAMLHTRYGTWHSPSIVLVPWQLLLASIFVLGAGLIVNPHPEITWTNRLILTSIYNGILATGFAYTAIIYVSQRLPVTTTSLLLLGVPVLDVIISNLWLGEKLTFETFLAIFLILGGLIVIGLESKKEVQG